MITSKRSSSVDKSVIQKKKKEMFNLFNLALSTDWPLVVTLRNAYHRTLLLTVHVRTSWSAAASFFFAKLHHCCNLYSKYLFGAEALFNASVILSHSELTQTERKENVAFLTFLCHIYSPTFVFLLVSHLHFFPFQFRTAQVGVSMSKECNTCVEILQESVVSEMSDLAPSQHLSPTSVSG